MQTRYYPQLEHNDHIESQRQIANCIEPTPRKRVVFVSLWSFIQQWDSLDPTVLKECVVIVNTSERRMERLDERWNLSGLISRDDILKKILIYKHSNKTLVFWQRRNCRWYDWCNWHFISEQFNRIVGLDLSLKSLYENHAPSRISLNELWFGKGNYAAMIELIGSFSNHLLPLMIYKATIDKMEFCYNRNAVMNAKQIAINGFGDNEDENGWVWIDYYIDD